MEAKKNSFEWTYKGKTYNMVSPDWDIAESNTPTQEMDEKYVINIDNPVKYPNIENIQITTNSKEFMELVADGEEIIFRVGIPND